METVTEIERVIGLAKAVKAYVGGHSARTAVVLAMKLLSVPPGSCKYAELKKIAVAALEG